METKKETHAYSAPRFGTYPSCKGRPFLPRLSWKVYGPSSTLLRLLPQPKNNLKQKSNRIRWEARFGLGAFHPRRVHEAAVPLLQLLRASDARYRALCRILVGWTSVDIFSGCLCNYPKSELVFATTTICTQRSKPASVGNRLGRIPGHDIQILQEIQMRSLVTFSGCLQP